MPNVLNEFAGDDVTRTFNFSMTGGYLSRDYVYFFIRPNDDLLNYTPYNDDDVTWLTDFSVRTASPIPVGTTFVILRSTTLDPLVDFQKTSRITEKNLDTATWQSIHIAAETSDTVGRIQVVAKDASMLSKQAIQEATDAADDAEAARIAAKAAEVSAGVSRAAATVAEEKAEQAAIGSQIAVGTAALADGKADAATLVAGAADSKSESAITTATAANIKAATAISAANAAVSTANAAESKANAAVGTADGASATAGAASATANEAKAIAQEAKDLIDDVVAGGVVSFNGRVGIITPQAGDYTKAQVGLGEVDNTSDSNKPLSTAAVAALATKADNTYVDTQIGTKAARSYVDSQLVTKADSTYVDTQLAAKADKTYVDTQLGGNVSVSTYNSGLSNNSTADRSRANHTGAQAISTITGLATELLARVRGDNANVAGFVAGNGAPYLRHASYNTVVTLATTNQPGTQSFASAVAAPHVQSTDATNGFAGLGYFDAGSGTRANRTLGAPDMGANLNVYALHKVGDFAAWRFDVEAAEFAMKNTGVGSSPGGWSATSDNRVKYNLRPIDGALDKVDALTGYTYIRQDMADSKGNMPVRSGVIAQEVLRALPSTVNVPSNYDPETNRGDLLSVSMDGLVGLLINAVKELRAEVNALKAHSN